MVFEPMTLDSLQHLLNKIQSYKLLDFFSLCDVQLFYNWVRALTLFFVLNIIKL